MVSSVYIHVPFCAKKCEYCAFYSEASNGARMDRYVAALVRELRERGSLCKPETVFFGGGTPSLLMLSHWQQIFDAFHELGWNAIPEFTVECNPATVSRRKAELFRKSGVNRISMGVQSLDIGLLERLGRVHSREMVFSSYQILREAGFDNINLDLMFAIPGQTLPVWKRTLDEIVEMRSEHVSAYEVIYEEDTPLYEQLQAGEIDVDDALAADMYQTMVDRLDGAGFAQYEIANFARGQKDLKNGLPERACRHNVNYWVGGEYLALGPAAAGHLNGERYQNWSNTDLYCQAVESGRPPRDGGERLGNLAKASETAAFSLRMNRGIDFEAFTARTGFDFERNWSSEAEQLVDRGWGHRDEAGFRLTRLGLRFADAAGAELLKT